MNFWVIANRYDEGWFHSFKEKEDVSLLNETCFLPSEEMAEGYIEDYLGTDYFPLQIKLITLQENGCYSYEIDTVREWDEE